MTIQAANDVDFGSAFVGTYMTLCSKVEEWAASILSPAVPLNPNCLPIKVPRMLGPKLRAVSDLVDGQPGLFAKPKRISELMNRFASSAKLRSDLAHSTLVQATNGTQTFYLFHTVDSGDRFWMTKTDMQNKMAELKQVVKEITDQKTKLLTPPSSPPQPKRGAATGP